MPNESYEAKGFSFYYVAEARDLSVAPEGPYRPENKSYKLLDEFTVSIGSGFAPKHHDPLKPHWNQDTDSTFKLTMSIPIAVTNSGTPPVMSLMPGRYRLSSVLLKTTGDEYQYLIPGRSFVPGPYSGVIIPNLAEDNTLQIKVNTFQVATQVIHVP